MKQVYLPITLANQLLTQALQSPDKEVCGMVAIDDSSNTYCYPIHNIASDPGRFFEMDPKQLIDCQRQVREKNQSLFAVYHSHPYGQCEPSPIDVEQFEYHDLIYLIIVPDQHGVMSLAGFYISSDKQVTKANLSTI